MSRAWNLIRLINEVDTIVTTIGDINFNKSSSKMTLRVFIKSENEVQLKDGSTVYEKIRRSNDNKWIAQYLSHNTIKQAIETIITNKKEFAATFGRKIEVEIIGMELLDDMDSHIPKKKEPKPTVKDNDVKLSIVEREGLVYAKNTKESALLNNLMKTNELGVVYSYIYQKSSDDYEYHNNLSVEKQFPELAPDGNPESKKRRTKKAMFDQVQQAIQILFSDLGKKIAVLYAKYPDGTLIFF